MAEGGIGVEKPIIPKKQRLLNIFRKVRGGGFGAKTAINNSSGDPQKDVPAEISPTPELHTSIERTQVIHQPEGDEMKHDPGFENDDDLHQTEERIMYAGGAEVKITQKGRVLRLVEGDKANFLVDVTDRVEPNQQMKEPENKKTVRELYPEFEDPDFNDLRGSNNGIIVTVTDRFSPDGEKRVYISHLGELVYDENDKGSFPDIEVLEKFDFTDRGHGLYVPWSFNSFLADEFFAKEIGEAFKEQQDVPDLPALEDPKVIEADYTVK